MSIPQTSGARAEEDPRMRSRLMIAPVLCLAGLAAI